MHTLDNTVFECRLLPCPQVRAAKPRWLRQPPCKLL